MIATEILSIQCLNYFLISKWNHYERNGVIMYVSSKFYNIHASLQNKSPVLGVSPVRICTCVCSLCIATFTTDTVKQLTHRHSVKVD